MKKKKTNDRQLLEVTVIRAMIINSIFLFFVQLMMSYEKQRKSICPLNKHDNVVRVEKKRDHNNNNNNNNNINTYHQ